MAAQCACRRVGKLVIPGAYVLGGVVHTHRPEEDISSVDGFVDSRRIELVACDHTRAPCGQVFHLARGARQYRDLRFASVEENVGKRASNVSRGRSDRDLHETVAGVELQTIRKSE